MSIYYEKKVFIHGILYTRKEISMKTEISMTMVWRAIRKNIAVIIVAAVLAGIAFGAVKYTEKPKYVSSAVLQSSNISGEHSYTSPTLIDAAKSIVGEYIVIIKNDDKFLDAVSEFVSEKSGGVYNPTAGQLKGMISAEQMGGDTSAFTVKVTSTDKVLAQIVCEGIVESVQPRMIDLYKRENSINVLSPESEAKMIENNWIVTAIIGFCAGAGLSSLIFILIAYFDRMIRTEEDVKGKFEIPIIGIIPKWEKE